MSKKVLLHLKKAKSNVPTVQAEIDDRPKIYLHSAIDPCYEAEQWVQRIKKMSDTLYVVLGVGLGYHLRAFQEKLPSNSYVMVIYTAHELSLLKVASQMSNSKWLDDQRLFYLELVNIHDMAIIIADIMIDKTIKKIHLCRHFPLMSLAEKEYEEVENKLIPGIEKTMAVNFTLKFHTNYSFFENYWRNFSEIAIRPGGKCLEGSFSDIPVIVVGSGPSLNKNIQELKKCVNKAVIIAAGSAIGALYKHGITPHILIVADANPMMYEDVKNYFSPETLLVATTTVEHRIVAKYSGPKCFVETSSDLSDKSFKEYLPQSARIKQNISITTAAVDFANYCGARTIVLVGQDLSYSDKKHHAEGIQTNSYEGLSTIRVPGYFGGEVDSNVPFKGVIDFYNEYVRENNHIEFINSTEGGAMIAAMRNVALQDVYKQLFLKEYDINELIKSKLNIKIDCSNYKHILKCLLKIRNQFEKIQKIVNDFCETNGIEKEIAVEQFFDCFNEEVFEKLYDRVIKHSAYRYIKSVMDIRMSLFEFQKRDGMPLEMQHQYYVNMTLGLKEIIVNFISWVDNNIDAIEKEVEHERGQG